MVLHFVSVTNYHFHPVFEISRFAFVSLGILLSVFLQRLFLTLAPIALHVGFQSFSILSPSSKMQSSLKSITVPIACIDVIASYLIELVSFSNSHFHAALIHLLLEFTIYHATHNLVSTKTSRSNFKPRPPASLFR